MEITLNYNTHGSINSSGIAVLGRAPRPTVWTIVTDDVGRQINWWTKAQCRLTEFSGGSRTEDTKNLIKNMIHLSSRPKVSL
jgi:hypothetical protein